MNEIDRLILVASVLGRLLEIFWILPLLILLALAFVFHASICRRRIHHSAPRPPRPPRSAFIR